MRIKMWLITAASLVALGLILFAGAMAAYDWDFTKLSTVKYKNSTYETSGNFDRISIKAGTSEIEFVPSGDDRCSIVCFEEEKVRHSAAVQNGTLVIDTVDTRKWYDYIGIFFGSPKMTVYLPRDKYSSLSIDTATGNVAIPECFTFENLEIEGSTAAVECLASVSNVMEIKLDTGKIKVGGLSAGEIRLSTKTGGINVDSVASRTDIIIETNTGAITLTDVACADFTAESSTGTVSLKNVVASGSFLIESNTGDVRFENSDASQISVRTGTGDVTGSFLSEKVFLTETSTGNVNVPNTSTGGKCEITTSTGDIKIRS